ncbi:hypothetical protein [Anderseniella sp. Alg231-50]|uniref:hypothetical protein n=1 Tax=Anderseniella sp. Alg231-50 TaxID=1922226 RepID=UPI00307C9851
MSQITKTAKSAMILAAGAVASAFFAGNVTTTANAETVYFGYETSFREAKQMCNGMHGRIFETERAQYGCTGILREEKAKKKTSVPPFVRGANDRPTKRQNFSGRDFSNDIGKVGGEGNGSGGGGGGGNGGGSAGGTF